MAPPGERRGWSGDRHAACRLEVLERLLAMGEVLNRLPRVAQGILACPTDEALGRAVVHAKAQDFLHLVLLIAHKGVNARRWFLRSVRPLPKPPQAVDVELVHDLPGGGQLELIRVGGRLCQHSERANPAG